jgi:hypothetical protein
MQHCKLGCFHAGLICAGKERCLPGSSLKTQPTYIRPKVEATDSDKQMFLLRERRRKELCTIYHWSSFTQIWSLFVPWRSVQEEVVVVITRRIFSKEVDHLCMPPTLFRLLELHPKETEKNKAKSSDAFCAWLFH